MEDVVCSECAAEADPEVKYIYLADEGWDLDGEFGPRCPECVVENRQAEGGGAGLSAVAEALGAVKIGEPKPIGIEFSAQVVDSSGLSGCVDYDPDYKGPRPPPVEKPKPDSMVYIPNKKE